MKYVIDGDKLTAIETALKALKDSAVEYVEPPAPQPPPPDPQPTPQPPAGDLPQGWSFSLVGVPEGSAKYADGVFEVTGKGGSIGYGNDAYGFISHPLTGDGVVVARMKRFTSLSGAGYGHAGIIIRANSSSLAALGVMNGRRSDINAAIAVNRFSLGDYRVPVSSVGSGVVRWLKLERSGSTIICSESADGTTWKEFTRIGMDLPQSVVVGFVAGSMAGCTAEFDRVSVTGAAALPPGPADPAPPPPPPPPAPQSPNPPVPPVINVQPRPVPDSVRTGIGVNTAFPDGEQLAQEYIRLRGIDPNNVFRINHASLDMETVASYESKIGTPFRSWLAARPGLKYFCNVGSFPSHVGYDSVDMRMARERLPNIAGAIDNPYRDGYTGTVQPDKVLLVTRIDSHQVEFSIALMRRAIQAEQSGVLKGKAYIDSRGIAQQSDAYGAMDRRFVAARDILTAALGASRVVFDEQNGLLMDMPDCLALAQWYSGSSNDAAKFALGAVAVHVESNTAYKVKYQYPPGNWGWVSKFIINGVTATWGATGEPTTAGYAPPDIVFKHLVAGSTFAHAFYKGVPYIGQARMVAYGDPLYSPRFV